MAPILRSKTNGKIKQQIDNEVNDDTKTNMQSKRKRKRNRNDNDAALLLSKETRKIDKPSSQDKLKVSKFL